MSHDSKTVELLKVNQRRKQETREQRSAKMSIKIELIRFHGADGDDIERGGEGGERNDGKETAENVKLKSLFPMDELARYRFLYSLVRHFVSALLLPHSLFVCAPSNVWNVEKNMKINFFLPSLSSLSENERQHMKRNFSIKNFEHGRRNKIRKKRDFFFISSRFTIHDILHFRF